MNGNWADQPDEDSATRFADWKRRLKQIERTVAQKGHRDLDRLARAGVNVRYLLLMLACAADEHGSDFCKVEIRKMKAKLGSMSARLEALSRAAKECAWDPRWPVEFWIRLDGQNPSHPMEVGPMIADPEISSAISGMNILAQRMRMEAGELGRFLRATGGTEMGVVSVLSVYWITCRKLDHLNELARLLTDAFDAAGKRKEFSADGLRQTFKRHVKPRLLRWLAVIRENGGAQGIKSRFYSEVALEGLMLPEGLTAVPPKSKP